MVKLSPLQGYQVEVVPAGENVAAIIGAAVNASQALESPITALAGYGLATFALLLLLSASFSIRSQSPHHPSELATSKPQAKPTRPKTTPIFSSVEKQILDAKSPGRHAAPSTTPRVARRWRAMPQPRFQLLDQLLKR